MMKKMNWESVMVLAVTVVLNKFLLVGLIGATERFLTIGFLCLAILNFVALAKAVDKMVRQYELSKHTRNNVMIKMPVS